MSYGYLCAFLFVHLCMHFCLSLGNMGRRVYVQECNPTRDFVGRCVFVCVCFCLSAGLNIVGLLGWKHLTLCSHDFAAHS